MAGQYSILFSKFEHFVVPWLNHLCRTMYQEDSFRSKSGQMGHLLNCFSPGAAAEPAGLTVSLLTVSAVGRMLAVIWVVHVWKSLYLEDPGFVRYCHFMVTPAASSGAHRQRALFSSVLASVSSQGLVADLKPWCHTESWFAGKCGVVCFVCLFSTSENCLCLNIFHNWILFCLLNLGCRVFVLETVGTGNVHT